MTLLVLSVLSLGCFAAGWICGAQREAMKAAKEAARKHAWFARAQSRPTPGAWVEMTMADGTRYRTTRNGSGAQTTETFPPRSVVMRFEEPAGPKN